MTEKVYRLTEKGNIGAHLMEKYGWSLVQATEILDEIEEYVDEKSGSTGAPNTHPCIVFNEGWDFSVVTQQDHHDLSDN